MADRLAALRQEERDARMRLDQTRAEVRRLHAALRQAEEIEDTAHRDYLKARDAVEKEEMR